MSHLNAKKLLVAISVPLLAAATATAAGTAVVCPHDTEGRQVAFRDGSTLIKTGLNVNPDGAVASYTPGDHGYTYIANGVNLWEVGRQIHCAEHDNFARCNKEWADAESRSFTSGTAEFCVYAMEVEPVPPSKKVSKCYGNRLIAGNGKGRPMQGATFPSVSGADAPTYLSMTSIKNLVGGNAVYVDSATVPGLVSPVASRLGSVVWVNYPTEKHSTFAVVNDSGGSYGEGTVALHRLLHRDGLGAAQPLGPIPASERCSKFEPTKADAPFVAIPDLGNGDICRPHFTPSGAAEIRAYGRISSGVQVILLPGVRFKTRGNVVQEQITIDRMKKLAEMAGYGERRLEQMAACAKN